MSPSSSKRHSREHQSRDRSKTDTRKELEIERKKSNGYREVGEFYKDQQSKVDPFQERILDVDPAMRDHLIIISDKSQQSRHTSEERPHRQVVKQQKDPSFAAYEESLRVNSQKNNWNDEIKKMDVFRQQLDDKAVQYGELSKHHAKAAEAKLVAMPPHYADSEVSYGSVRSGLSKLSLGDEMYMEDRGWKREEKQKEKSRKGKERATESGDEGNRVTAREIKEERRLEKGKGKEKETNRDREREKEEKKKRKEREQRERDVKLRKKREIALEEERKKDQAKREIEAERRSNDIKKQEKKKKR